MPFEPNLQPALARPEEVSRRQTWLMLAIFAATAGVVLFYELGGSRTLGSHEVFAAVPAREMMESDNWVVPRFGGIPRLRKPPLAYWTLAGTAHVFGSLNEWTVRFPAAVSALLLSLLVGYWGVRWYGKTAGFAAAVAQVVSINVLVYARKAEIDMLLCLLITASLFLIAQEQPEDSRRSRFLRWTTIYALLALSWLAKFHYGLAMVMGPCVIYWIIQKRYRSIFNLFNPIGLALFSAAVLIWPYLLLQQVPEAWSVWQTETVGRAVGALGHKPIWYYLPHILWLSLPCTPFALAAIPASWKQAWKQADARERFLWVWFLTHLFIVSISANKHNHYIIAALPMFSLLAGRQFSVIVDLVRRGKHLLTFRTGVICSIVILAAQVAIPVAITFKWPALAVPSAILGVIVGVGGLTVVWLLFKQKTQAGGIALVAVFLGCFVIVTGSILPGRDHRLAVTMFAKDVRNELTEQQEIYVYGMGEDEVVYYLDSPVRRIESLEETLAHLSQEQSLYVVTLASNVQKLSDVGDRRILKWMSVPQGMVAPKHEPLLLLELKYSERKYAATMQHISEDPTDSNRLATESRNSDTVKN